MKGWIEGLKEKDKALEILDELCKAFQALEIASKAWFNWLMDKEEVSKDLKRKNQRPTKENIEKIKNKRIELIRNSSKRKKRLGSLSQRKSVLRALCVVRLC